jgi:hypothetical protein
MPENISQWWENFRYTQAFKYTVILVVMGSICFALIIANLYLKPSDSGVSSVNPDKSTKPSLLKNFADSNNLTKIADTQAKYGYLYFFDNKLTYLTQDLRIIQAGGILQSKSAFIPNTVYNLGDDKLLVNQKDSSTTLNTKDGLDLPFSESIFSITPLNDKYFFIQKRLNSFALKRASNLDFTDAKTILEVTNSQLGNPDSIQIRLFGNIPYLVTSVVNSSNLEDINFYRFSDQGLDKKLGFKNVISKLYEVDKVLISVQNDTKIIDTNVVDLSDSDNISSNLLEIKPQLVGLGVKGDIVAQRCDFSMNKPKLLCMVKKDSFEYWNNGKQDVFVEYDIETNKTQLLYGGLNISANSVFYSPNEEVYIFGQENNLIYRVK